MKPWAYGLGRASKRPWGLSRTGAGASCFIIWPSLELQPGACGQLNVPQGHMRGTRAQSGEVPVGTKQAKVRAPR